MSNQTKKVPQVGEVYVVTGYGLMQVAEVDGDGMCVRMRGHGPAKTTGHWFYADRLRGSYGATEVLRERAEAAARGVSCNNPDCWCRVFENTPRVGGAR